MGLQPRVTGSPRQGGGSRPHLSRAGRCRGTLRSQADSDRPTQTKRGPERAPRRSAFKEHNLFGSSARRLRGGSTTLHKDFHSSFKQLLIRARKGIKRLSLWKPKPDKSILKIGHKILPVKVINCWIKRIKFAQSRLLQWFCSDVAYFPHPGNFKPCVCCCLCIQRSSQQPPLQPRGRAVPWPPPPAGLQSRILRPSCSRTIGAEVLALPLPDG